MAEGVSEVRVTADFPQLEEGVSDEVRDPVCKLHNLPIQFYCEEHSKPVCCTCKLMEHRKCPLQNIDHAASAGSTDGSLEVFQQLREATTYIEKIGETIVDEQKVLGCQGDAAIEQIEKKVKEIEALGQKQIAEVKELIQQERARLESDKNDIAQTQVLVEESVHALQRVKQIGSKEEIFVESKNAEANLSKFQAILHDSSKVYRPQLDFEIDNKLKNLTSLGRANVETSVVTVSPVTTIILNTGPIEDIRWIDVLPGHKMILLEAIAPTRTSQLRLYSNVDKKLLSTLELRYATSADMLNDLQVIVAMPLSLKLQIVNIDNDKLTLGSVIKTDVYPIIIRRSSDSSVLVHALPGYSAACCFEILDLTGAVQKHIEISTDLPGEVFMKMGPERNDIYIVEMRKGCLGVNLQGDMLFHYTHPDYVMYGGLAVDSHGVLYFSVFKKPLEFECIIKLSPTGQVLGQIDTRNTYIDVFPMQCIGNQLLAYGSTDEKNWAVLYIYV